MQTDRSELNPALRAECRLTEQHYRQQHYQIEDVESTAVLLQAAIIEIHEEDREHDVYECEKPLPLHKPKSFFARRVDVRRAADDHDAVNDDRQRRNQQFKIDFAEESLCIR